MIPSTFVLLSALSLTPNGKVDRRALPAPDQSRPELAQRFVAPRTAIEEALAKIWAEVLKLERVGIHDKFFDLGGHSLPAAQMIARLNDALQMDIPLRAVFESATVADMALHVAQTKTQNDEDFLRRIDRRPGGCGIALGRTGTTSARPGQSQA